MVQNKDKNEYLFTKNLKTHIGKEKHLKRSFFLCFGITDFTEPVY